MPPHRLPPPRPQDVIRSRPVAVSDAVREAVTGRRVLVTGSAGTLGGALARRLVGLRPAAVHLIDVDAARLHAQELDLGGGDPGPRVALVDVRDSRALDAAVRAAAPDLVLHAAGHAHAALLERSAGTGVATHVWGTQNVVQAAARHGVDRFVHVSGDDAADPTGVLGAVQRVAEDVVREEGAVRTASVRVGQVLGPRGALWEVLARHVPARAPGGLGDPDQVLSLTTPEDAAALVLEVAALEGRCGTYALAPSEHVRARDLVQRYAAASGVPAPPLRPLAPPRPAPASVAAPHGRPTRVDGVRRCPAPPPPPGFARVLADLYAAADDADDARVRHLLAQRFGRLAAGPVAPDAAPRGGERPVLRLLGPVPA